MDRRVSHWATDGSSSLPVKIAKKSFSHKIRNTLNILCQLVCFHFLPRRRGGVGDVDGTARSSCAGVVKGTRDRVPGGGVIKYTLKLCEGNKLTRHTPSGAGQHNSVTLCVYQMDAVASAGQEERPRIN